ncbi:alpha-1,4-glucan--maltose-1-phosphate maltosyltransferase [Actinomyces sp. B33]|uniref:alpha-1,4-glucan--maltose-1-phosphate maltosyltransferase n=1 Tax=Actinomyces sp. B33 TaxID=2942131 RepID=UPI002341F052|nr:alpha-1,4-glucan--maltose-1-phosphate maltosyltransferase [Actinomyces sp. B33]MDC4232870.1 alpha-1,4-glucan--maltose-1-phosphate maltosyltransferase [Actinomyces sp. B33]
MSDTLLPRIPAVELFPVVEDGTLPAKAAEAEPFPIRATVFREGHDAYAAEAVLIDPRGREHSRTPMADIAPGLDRYEAWVVADRPGPWRFRVDTWSDPYATWRHDATVKIDAGVDVELMLEEGARLMDRAAAGRALGSAAPSRPSAEDASVLRAAASAMRDRSRSDQQRLSAGVASRVRDVFSRHPLRDLLGSTRSYPLAVARERALTGAWYEIFPRSAGAFQRADGSWESGTLRTAAAQLDRIAAMGFDVVYLTPIHPIGTTHRKGRNNSLTAGASDPGSPYGIGSPDGGHDAIHPDLGGFDDFDAFVAAARGLGLEVALDLALQCSPDHPWVAEHPEWFTSRADGTIAYAENPPKKYQDIYPLNFDNDPEGIYAAIREVVEVWIDHGVTIFRVDNPHTKPVRFWQRFIADVQADHPEVFFLAEAFTRPAMMRTLGAVGFDQSYTYFAWRTGKEEIEDYLREVSTRTAHLLRPSFWPTTHDILTPQMTTGGIAIHAIRAMLAALGSPTWGVYSGYELVEDVQRPGFEEHNDNEKYEYRPRDWSAAEPLGVSRLFCLLNAARAKHPALRQLHDLRIHPTSHPSVLCFSKRVPARFTESGIADAVICVISLDPHAGVEATVDIDLSSLGVETTGGLVRVVDELDGMSYTWGASNWVSLSPLTRLGHVFAVEPLTGPRAGA